MWHAAGSRRGTGGLAVLTVGFVVTLAALPGGSSSAAAQDGSRDLPREIGAYMERVEEERGFSGSVLVARNGELILHEGYGVANEATGEAVTQDTVFDVASLAKQFTAAAVLKLEEQGHLEVRDR